MLFGTPFDCSAAGFLSDLQNVLNANLEGRIAIASRRRELASDISPVAPLAGAIDDVVSARDMLADAVKGRVGSYLARGANHAERGAELQEADGELEQAHTLAR